jgi:hypothetical protein
VSTTGQTGQTPCAAGSYSSGSGAVSCTLATPGNHVGSAGQTSQTPCALGTFSSGSGAVNCTLAPLNTYVATTGAIAPTACPTGTFTLQTGSKSKAACLRFAITTMTLPNGTLFSASNVAYSAKLAAKGGKVPYTWSIASGALPTGLRLNHSTGVIAGRATKLGSFTFTIKVVDTKTSSHAQLTAKRTFTIQITK